MASLSAHLVPGVVLPGELAKLQAIFNETCVELEAPLGSDTAVSLAKVIMDAYRAGIRDDVLLTRLALIQTDQTEDLFQSA